MASAAGGSSSTTAAVTGSDLARIASRPENRVLQWAQPGDRREGAFSAVQLETLLDHLKGAVVATAAAHPSPNELVVRWQLSRQQVPGAPEGYTWGAFAEHYPTFWGRLTSAAATRKDVICIHAMVEARRRFEAGEIATEQEVEAQIQSDLLALNLDTRAMEQQQGQPGQGQDGGSRRRGRGGGGSGGAGGAAGNAEGSPEMRQLVQQARLRRTLLERAYASARVPAEELARLGVAYSPSVSCLHAIREEEEALAKALAKPGSRKAQERKRQLAALKPFEFSFARLLLQLRAAIAKRCLGLPEPLDPKGASFMPTYTRSAQSDLAWEAGEADAWRAPPAVLSL
jgi:hypothetical protein